VAGFLKSRPALNRLNVYLSPDAGTKFGVKAIPTLVILGRDGKIAASFLGTQTPETIQRALTAAGVK
jgi:thioredoxin-like negative regulator of GroEL